MVSVLAFKSKCILAVDSPPHEVGLVAGTGNAGWVNSALRFPKRKNMRLRHSEDASKRRQMLSEIETAL